MNPYQIVGIIAGSMLVFAMIVAALTLAGVPLIVAFLGVYLVTMWFMIGMQRRAQQSCNFREQRRMRAILDSYNDGIPQTTPGQPSTRNKMVSRRHLVSVTDHI